MIFLIFGFNYQDNLNLNFKISCIKENKYLKDQPVKAFSCGGQGKPEKVLKKSFAVERDNNGHSTG